MSSQSRRITALMWVALTGMAFAQGPGAPNAKGRPALQIGTTLHYVGERLEPEGPAAPCQWGNDYFQDVKVTGQVILKETQANVYLFVEYWGRDDGFMALRPSPRGHILRYSGTQYGEVPFLISGPTGTFSEFFEAESGREITLWISNDDHSPGWLPPGEIYEHLTRIDNYCTNCGPTPVLTERYWVNKDLGFFVASAAWEDEAPCSPGPARRLWLVDITRK